MARTALRWVGFLLAVGLLVWGPFERRLADGLRYGYLPDAMPSDWLATNVWLDSTDCALQRGAWLALCEGGHLVAIGERAVADDPGHALLLEMWSLASGRRATLVDVARLNTLVDAIGLVALAGLVFALRAYATAVFLLWVGSAEYLTWMGVSPHWSHIGLASLGALLPLALAAGGLGLIGRRSARAWIAGGAVALALACLMRESIGLMGLAATLAAVVGLGAARRPIVPLAVGLALAILALGAPRAIVLARDWAFPIQPAQRIATHGLSHTLYLGLGTVENKWGIRYDDAYGEAIAARSDPPIVFGSPAYFRLMAQLYAARWLEDPLEVLRIYLEKAWRLSSAHTMSGVPAFGMVLLLGLIHLVAATRTGAWARLGFPQGLVIETVALVFLLLFLAQAMAALPDQTYAMPANGFIVLLLGLGLEFLLRLVLRVRRAG